MGQVAAAVGFYKMDFTGLIFLVHLQHLLEAIRSRSHIQESVGSAFSRFI